MRWVKVAAAELPAIEAEESLRRSTEVSVGMNPKGGKDIRRQWMDTVRGQQSTTGLGTLSRLREANQKAREDGTLWEMRH